MQLKEIHRYPVKSMGGSLLNRTTLGRWGIPGDRAWAVKDETRNSIKGGKRFPELMAMKASFTSEPNDTNHSPPLTITLPDDQIVSSGDNDINQKLSSAIGAPVSLWPLLPEAQLEHYRREPMTPGTDIEASLRQTFARTAEEPLPDLSGFPKEIFEFESPPGTYFDAFPLLLMTTGSLETMQAHSKGSNYDLRRFRPNLVIDLSGSFPEDGFPEDGFPEDKWVGREATLGSATLRFEMVCPRCVMTTHGFRDLPKDPTVMRELVQHNAGNLGVYCNIITPGSISVGDQLILL
ncbi:MAG: hypothetical protein ACJAXW_004045 [Candidatus Azotimanducaceae bacterium]|jgi:uncharacterized protein YcbX